MCCDLNDVCHLPTTGTAAATFTSALRFFTAAQCLITENWPQNAEVKDGDIFDFIIVGAGSAGSVVANRLSEVKEWNVLLIEAGGDPPIESTIPSFDSTMFLTKYDWSYKTTNNGKINQANRFGSINWIRGKMLGGSSSINAMIYIRGNHHDFLEWYDLGNKEWHPNIVQKYFRKAESYENDESLQNNYTRSFYGDSGPQTVNRFNSSYNNIFYEVLKSWHDIGFKNVENINAAGSWGSGIYDATASNGKRRSTAITYLNPVRNRENLKLLKNSHVSKILINRFKRAYGVNIVHNRNKIELFAAKEVIVSAGAINTPQLLMLSGIGPAKHLLSKRIKPKVDSPAVGENLSDHMIIPITIYADELCLRNDKVQQNFDIIQYLYNQTGSLSQGRLGNIVAFYSTGDNSSYPQFESLLTVFDKKSSKAYDWANSIANFKPPIVNSLMQNNANHSLYLFLFTLLHPYSRGEIILQSNNYQDAPLIYPNYFGDPRDLDLAVKGIKMMTKVLQTNYFKSIGAYLGRMRWPACDSFALDTEEYWRCVCINMVLTTYHPIGTASMGPDPDTSVVNSRLRVHKVKGLRVIDASVMPTETSGNTNAPTIMVGERGSDLIKEDYNKYFTTHRIRL